MVDVKIVGRYGRSAEIQWRGDACGGEISGPVEIAGCLGPESAVIVIIVSPGMTEPAAKDRAEKAK
jgi:hypothetical protein